MEFIFLLVFGILLLIGLINAVRVDYKRYKNAWSFKLVIGYCFIASTLTFIVVTAIMTARYGRLADALCIQ